jgi:beta-N-acetylhexosaminidase
MHDAGMKTTGKHFPGHGSVQADSHVDDVTDPRSLAEIAASDLLPFKSLAGALDAMMIAHVVYPAVDSLPAGYSKVWLQDILRGDLGYRGVVLSDDLGMHAARTVGGLTARTRLCLEAGCELVLICQPADVRELLGQLDGSPVDAGAAVARLYGRPTVDREELAAVAREGIREWGHWQRSLEQLGEQAWA